MWLYAHLVEPVDLFDATLMAAAGEFRSQKRFHDVHSLVVLERSSREREHVGVIVFARQSRSGGITDQRRADTRHFVGSDGHADSGAANDDTKIVLAAGNAACRAFSEIRVVHGFLGRGAD